MSTAAFNQKFSMPMFRDFIPERIRPWIYLCMIFAFQLSGCIFPAAINEVTGEYSMMREDILMCNFVTLAGMAITFPILFRMKFCFTNKTLLTLAATGMIVCNILSIFVTSLPFLWIISFFAGYCKLQGTFECVSNIQLWLTPKRDFTIFFPSLNLVILTCISLSSWITSYLTYYFNWQSMNLFTIVTMLMVLFIVRLFTKHFRIMKKMPLYGIDWLGAILWSVLCIEIIYLFTYGEYYNWWDSDVIQKLSFIIIITALICWQRMRKIRHPFLEPAMWRYRHLWEVLLLITIMEIFLATEFVLEKIMHENILHYNLISGAPLYLWTIVGVISGCLFSLLWMKVLKYSYIRLITVGIAALSVYMVMYYFIISPFVNIEKFFLPAMIRGFSYGILSATFMTCLEEITTFQHFFQSLCVFNMLHMFIGGAIGSALYSFGIRYFMADSINRYGSYLPKDSGYIGNFIPQMQMISIKSVYGIVAYCCIGVLFIFLLYDTPVRSTLKRIPNWSQVGKGIKRLIN